jgi:tetratricopeptide (TPR) repeat protein
VSFTCVDTYTGLLKAASVDPRILVALHSVKAVAAAPPESSDDSALLQHLSNAGSMTNAGQLDDATIELSTSLHGRAGKAEAGFVTGMILIDRKRYEDADAVYSEIVAQDPDFPQIHTRLSLTRYYTGDPEQAFREAKAALARNPNDPSAHLNAGLALRNLRKFDAAKSEMEASVRSKPDFELGYAALGFLFEDIRDLRSAIAQYKKALALNRGDVATRYNLGVRSAMRAISFPPSENIARSSAAVDPFSPRKQTPTSCLSRRVAV